MTEGEGTTFLFICFPNWKVSPKMLKCQQKSVKLKQLWSYHIEIWFGKSSVILIHNCCIQWAYKEKKWGNNLSNYLFFSFLFSLKDYCFDVLDKDKPLLSNYCLLFSSKYIFQITHFDVKFQWNKIMKARMQIVKL